MIGRLIGGTLVGAVLSGIAIVVGYEGYQAYLKWLVAGQGPAVEPPGTPSPDAAPLTSVESATDN